jgi:hypothetical protein
MFGSEETAEMRMKAIGTMVALALACGLALEPARAQGKGQPQLRTVHGSVIDHDENPVPSSIVYLKNLRSQAVKTYIADDSGHYRFSGLDPNVDYEVHAEKGDLTSANRTVSSFDSRKDIEVILKLDKKKTSH